MLWIANIIFFFGYDFEGENVDDLIIEVKIDVLKVLSTFF